MLKRLSLIALLGLAPAPFITHAADAPKADQTADTKFELPKPNAEGFIPMFNGKDLTGWKGMEGFWSVKDGMIVGAETKETSKQTFLIFQAAFSDFEMHFKYKWATPTGNSGVQFRSKLVDPATSKLAGYQADFDAGNVYTGIIYDEADGAGRRGVMSNRGEKTHWDADNKRTNEKLGKSSEELKAVIKKDDWNDCVVIAKGNHITYSTNGETTTDLLDESPKAVKDGLIGLQIHAGFTMEIQFKDLLIKPLTDDKK